MPTDASVQSLSIKADAPAPPSPASHRLLTYGELDILHALRGFCAFYVVIFHAKYILWSGGKQYLAAFPRTAWGPLDYVLFAADMLSSAGYEMVVFFFVLSGFFIRYAQLKKHRRPLDFYLNRIVRIYPPYLASVLLAAVLLTVIAWYVPSALREGSARELNNALAWAWQDIQQFQLLDAGRVLLFLGLKHLYIGNNDVYWSLLPEALFYLFVPLAFWRIKVYYVVSGLAWIAGVILAYVGVSSGPIATYWLTYNVYFALGVGLYDLITQTHWLAYFRRLPNWAALAIAMFLFASLLPLVVLKAKIISGALAAVLAVWEISCLLAEKVSRQNPAIRLMHHIGLYSFSLYLYHFPLLLLCYAGLVSLTGELVFYTRYYWLALPVVTMACYGLYWITERASVNYFRKV